MNKTRVSVRADRELRKGLARLIPGGVGDVELTQDAADAMLARVVWSHLVEPGDAVSVTLIDVLGAGSALDLLASGSGAKDVYAALGTMSGKADVDLPVSVQQVAAGIKRWLPRLERTAVLEEILIAATVGAHVIVPEAQEWPELLNDLGAHAPVLLWVRGDASTLANPSLAVVGARACTSYGTYVTADLTSDACASGLTIVSGAAYGVDAVAHRSALAASAPTVAVLAGGVDRPYPSAHGPLLEQIASAGVVCSEVVPGTAPTRWRFLQRNRIIASLARATLVTEAGPRSGSLNTAGHAAEMSRPLGAVPGPVTNPASLGCHRLIREYGATLVSNGAELRELVGLQDVPMLDDSIFESSGLPREPVLHRRVGDALPLRGSRATTDIARIAGITLDDARSALAELELLGAVVRRETPDGGELRWSQVRRE